jgi:recombination protein RecA
LAELPSALRRAAASLRSGRAGAEPGWRLGELGGRLVELSGACAHASLSLAFSLVGDAQRRGEPVAWIGGRATSFFPPDADAAGVDLDALAVVRVPRETDVPHAADGIARSGAFGLIVLDLGLVEVPMPLQSRLLSLAVQHDCAVVCLTDKPPQAASLSSLVSLRAQARLRRRGAGEFECELATLKDKRRSAPWRHVEVRRAVAGLR